MPAAAGSFPPGQIGSHTGADDSGNIFGSSAQTVFLHPSLHQGPEGEPRSDPQDTDTFWTMELLGAQADCRRGNVGDIDRNHPGGEHGIGMKRNAPFRGDRRKLMDWLHGSDFTNRVADRDQGCVRFQRFAKILRVDFPGSIHLQEGHPVTQFGKSANRVETGHVFNGGCDDVPAVPPGKDPLDGEVVRFRTAGREQDLFGQSREEASHPLPGGFNSAARFFPEMVRAGGIAEFLPAKKGQHGGNNLRVGNGGGKIIKIQGTHG